MAPDHAEYFSVPIPDYILQVAAAAGHAADRAERRRDVRPEARGAGRVLGREPPQDAAAYEQGIYKDEIVPLEVEDPVFDAEGNWVEAERGKTVAFDRDECMRPDTTAREARGAAAAQGRGRASATRRS